MEEELYRIVDVIGARHMTAVAEFEGGGGLPEVSRLAECFHQLCARAADHGLLVALEFIPQLTVLKDLKTANAIVTAANSPNGGVQLDSWHLYQSGGSPDDVRTLTPGVVVAVQLNDGPPPPRISDASTFERSLPGEGSFDLTGLLGGLAYIGFDGPIGAEIIHPDLQALPLQQAADASYRATERALAEASYPIGAAHVRKGGS